MIDPSDALEVAKRNLSIFDNCVFHQATVDQIPLEDESYDFGCSLGMPHHISDFGVGRPSRLGKLKKDATFLLYLYYRFDDRPAWFRALWKASDVLRRKISRMLHSQRYAFSQAFAFAVYLPLARAALLAEKLGINVEKIPLSQYRNNSFYTMRTDALDRFGTQLEKRFTKIEMQQMMERTGLENIVFSETSFWTAVGFKK